MPNFPGSFPDPMPPLSPALQRGLAKESAALEAENRSLLTQRKELLSAIKQHRNATESRLRLLDSRGEAAKSMLKPDRDLYEAAERVGGGGR